MPLTIEQQAFADELSFLWNQEDCGEARRSPVRCGCPGSPHPVTHWYSYRITTHRSWGLWKSGHPGGTTYQRDPVGTRDEHWWCDSLRQAARHYSWEWGRVSFSDLAADLQGAIARRNDQDTATACVEIFKGGGVDQRRDNEGWVSARLRAGDLIERLEEGVELLRPGCTLPLSRFDGHILRMNSAMTKVYAAADPTGQVIIYDGRVGAALCRLIRHHLRSIGRTALPAGLDLMWGPHQDPKQTRPSMRDPSEGEITFRKLNGAGVTNEDRARTCRTASAILSAATRGSPLREIEKALFMIGYAVRTPWAVTCLQ